MLYRPYSRPPLFTTLSEEPLKWVNSRMSLEAHHHRNQGHITNPIALGARRPVCQPHKRGDEAQKANAQATLNITAHAWAHRGGVGLSPLGASPTVRGETCADEAHNGKPEEDDRVLGIRVVRPMGGQEMRRAHRHEIIHANADA